MKKTALRTIVRWQDASRSALAGRVVVVIDVLRWSTVVVTALAHGASRVEAFAEPAEAMARAREVGRDGVVLGGERGNLALPGFDLGNSPAEYTAALVGGRVVVTTTSNGTQALLAAGQAQMVCIGAFVNLGAISARLRAVVAEHDGRDITLLAAGTSGAEALEDTACAGAIAAALARSLGDHVTLDEATRRAIDIWQAHAAGAAEVIASAPHAAALRATGHDADLAFAARVDAHGIVPEARGASITLREATHPEGSPGS